MKRGLLPVRRLLTAIKSGCSQNHIRCFSMSHLQFSDEDAKFEAEV